MIKWEPYKKRIMFKKSKKSFSRYECLCKRSSWAQFMFRISMDERREPWLNNRKKFYSSMSLRDFNIGRKRKGWTMTSVQENRKRFENIVYWGEY